MKNWSRIFSVPKAVIAVVHIGALPGTPRSTLTVDQLFDLALEEAMVYQEEGVDAIMIENMHDLPYMHKNVGPEITASMAVIACRLKKSLNLPMGIQILAAANHESLAVAQAAGLDFIRAEGFISSHISDEGFMDGCAGPLMRYRKNIGAEGIAIFTDIKKCPTTRTLNPDQNAVDMAKAALFFMSYGIVVTGAATGQSVDIGELKEIDAIVNIPILIGSGITPANLAQYWELANGFIVGSCLKENGYWGNPVDRLRVRSFMSLVNRLREQEKPTTLNKKG
jgi:membrane complex biogenesis BtpA family protein